MLEKWTNTSSAPSREMKPKPFSALKNFTVPVAMFCFSVSIHANSGSRRHPPTLEEFSAEHAIDCDRPSRKHLDRGGVTPLRDLEPRRNRAQPRPSAVVGARPLAGRTRAHRGRRTGRVVGA